MGLFNKLKPGKYTNRKGKQFRINSDCDADSFFADPNVREQITGMKRIYMQETLIALHEGRRPPHSVGKYGTLTKKKLIIEWNDDWQAEMDKVSKYYDVTYNSFFNIPTNGGAPSITAITATSIAEIKNTIHPPVKILLTANKIAEQYGSKKES